MLEKENEAYKKKLDDMNSIRINVEKISDKMDELKEKVTSRPYNDDGRLSYADTLKARKKQKNLLIVESADSTQNLKESMHSDLVEGLGTTQVLNMRGKEKKITMNFECENTRDEAAKKIAEISGIKIKSVKKSHPKIRLLEVNGREDSENLVNVIIDRNSCLNRIERIKEKMKIVFKRPSRTIGCFEYVLKCDPEVRKEIRLNEDKISLTFGTYDVVDNYHVTICYHCQRHGHIANSCPDKER